MYWVQIHPICEYLQKLGGEAIPIIALRNKIRGWECTNQTNFDRFDRKLQSKRSLERYSANCGMVSEKCKCIKGVKKEIIFKENDFENVASIKSEWWIEQETGGKTVPKGKLKIRLAWYHKTKSVFPNFK